MSAATTIDLVRPRRVLLSKTIFAAGCLLAIVLFALLAMPRSSARLSTTTAPNFSLTDVNGTDNVSLTSRGGKPAVVNFFASWCIPCRAEMPRLAAQAKAHPEIAFFGIDHQDSRSQARDLITASGVTYPNAYDPTGSVAAEYGLTTGLPATVFIDSNGQIAHTQYGEISESVLRAQLSRLAGEK